MKKDNSRDREVESVLKNRKDENMTEDKTSPRESVAAPNPRMSSDGTGNTFLFASFKDACDNWFGIGSVRGFRDDTDSR